MKRAFKIFILLLAWGGVYGQMTGTYTIPGAIPTIDSAFKALNEYGAGNNGVTFLVSGGYAETTSDSLILSISGKSTGPIIFQKSGSGSNPVVNRINQGFLNTGLLGAQGDAVIVLNGCDYVIFDGIDVSASQSGIEYGYYLIKAGSNDGCKNVVIRNCAITMNRGTSGFVTGIYLSNNDITTLVSNATGITTLTGTGGRNENIELTGNTISNVSTGILLRGYKHTTPPYNFCDTNCMVGAYGSGNVIRNFGALSPSTFAGSGIHLENQKSPNVSFNNIQNTAGGGSNANGSINGIWFPANTYPSGGNVVMNNNTIILGQGSTAAAMGINLTQLCSSITLTYNIFGFGTFASTTASYLIFANSASSNVTVSYNSTTGTINKTGTSGAFMCYYNQGSGTGGSEVISNNSFTNITLTGTSAFTAIHSTVTVSPHQVKDIFNNQISNITSGSGDLYGINATYGSTVNIYANTIHSITSAGDIYGIQAGAGTAATYKSYDNTIYGITTTGADKRIIGIAATNAASGTNITSHDLYRNKIYNLTAAGAIGTTWGMSANRVVNLRIYNNMISDLKAPVSSGVNAVQGINILGVVTTASVFYNTIFLNASSTAATFGTSALTVNATPALDLRNNILINKSNHKGNTGFTTALRRSAPINSTNYLATCNTNDFYVSSNLPILNYIYYDGTNKDSTIAQFKARVAPRDAGSFSEDPPFINQLTAPYDLHIQPVQTKCESGGSEINTPFVISSDFDLQPRYPEPGYPNDPMNPASAPDVGADEFAGIPSYNCTIPTPGSTNTTANNLCLGEPVILTIQNTSTGTGNLHQWQVSTDGINYTNITSATDPMYSFTPQQKAYYRCEVICQAGPFTAYSTPLQITFTNEITSASGSERCGTGTVKLLATGSTSELGWYTTASGGAAVGYGSPFFTPVLTSTTQYFVGAETNGPQELPVGAGNLTSNNPSNPWFGTNSNSRNQHLIRSEELYAAGFSAGNLTSIGLDITNYFTLPLIDLTVKAGLTGTNTLSSFDTVNLTTVFTSPSYLPVPGLNKLSLTTPVYWDGVSNLLLEFCHGNPASIAQMLRTCRSNTTSFVSTIHTHLTYGVSGNVVCDTVVVSQTTTYSQRPQFYFTGNVVCTSPRIQVSAVVNPAPPFAITSDLTVCNNSVNTLTVLTNHSDYETYVWSPLTNLFLDLACTIPYTGTSATTVYQKSSSPGAFDYSCQALHNTTFCTGSDQVMVTVLPDSPQIFSTPPSLCLSGSAVLSLALPSSPGAALFQWQESGDGIIFTEIPGATSSIYQTAYIGMTTHYKCLIKNSDGVGCSEAAYTLNVGNPLITGTTPGFHCGPGTVVLEAVSTTGQVTWFDSPAGGAPIGNGSPFTTPFLWSTKTYYVSALEPGTILEPAGRQAPLGTENGTMSNYGLVFNAHDNIKLQSVDIYPILYAGEVGVALYNSSMTLVGGPLFFSYPAGDGSTPFSLPVDFQVNAGDGYRLILTNISPNGNLMRETPSSSGLGTPLPFPISRGSLITITGAISSLGGIPETSNYNWFYNWRVMKGCASPLIPVTATINLAPFYELTPPQSVCNNEPALITVSNGTSYFNRFTWNPPSNLYTNPDCTIPYISGTNTSTVYFKTAQHGNYQVIGYANNTNNGCTNFDTTRVVVLPAAIQISSQPDTICVSGSATLSLLPAMEYQPSVIQWQWSSDNINYADIPGATLSSYTTDILTSPLYFRVSVKNTQYSQCLTAQYYLYVDNPVITGITAGNRCGTGEVTLGASSSSGSTIRWYDTPYSASIMGTGTTFTTPPISQTRNFYVMAFGSSGISGPLGVPQNGASTTSSITAGLQFDVLSPSLTIEGVHIYPIGTGAGTVTVSLKTATGEVIEAKTVSCTGTPSPGIKTWLPLNWTINTGSGYLLQMTGLTGLVTSLIRDAYSTLPGGAVPVNPYCRIDNIVSISGGFTTVPAQTYYYFYDWTIESGCSSTRIPVEAVVYPGTPVNITPPRTICRDDIHQISVTSGQSDYNEFHWTPFDNLYTDNAGTIPYMGETNFSTLYFRSSEPAEVSYTCHGINTLNQCNSTAQTTVTVLPDPEIRSNPLEICQSGSAMLSLIPASGYGAATFQWRVSDDNIAFSDIPGATNSTYSTPVAASTKYYNLILRNSLGAICAQPVKPVIVNQPQLLSVASGSRCGPGVVTLGATVNPGSEVNWYTAPAGGAILSTGPVFTTPPLSATTSYFAAATAGFVNQTNIPSPGPGSTGNFQTGTGWGLHFNVTYPADIVSVKMYPKNSNAGPATLQVKITDMNDNLLFTGPVHSFNVSTTVTEQVVPVYVSLSPGTYKMVMSATGINFLTRETTGVSYPYSSPGGEVMITAGGVGPGTASSATSYLWFYQWNISTKCESPRQEVLASVTPPPDLTISNNKTICPGEVYPIQVTSLQAMFDQYNWSPVDALFLDPACSIPCTASSNTSIVYFKSLTAGERVITCSASNSTGLQCTNSTSLVVTVLPDAYINSVPGAICYEGTATLRLVPESGYGAASVQWMSSADNVTFTLIAGATNTIYNTSSLSVTTYYKAVIRNQDALVCSEPSYTLTVNSPQILGVTPGIRCGLGIVGLEAQAAGGTVNWYDQEFGGHYLGSGTQFTTPVIAETTTFWAEAAAIVHPDLNLGIAAPVNSTVGSQTSVNGLWFDANAAFSLKTVDIYPTGPENASGTVTVSVINSAGTTLHQAIVPVTIHQSPTWQVQTLELNFNIMPENNLRLVITARSSEISGILFQPNGSITFAYPYQAPGVVSITGSTVAGSTLTTAYHYFYNWNITEGCSSSRTAVTAVVTPSIPVIASAFPRQVCQGSAVSLHAASSNNDYEYQWFPGNLLGPDQSVTPEASTTYIVLATDPLTNCADADTLTIGVLPVPSDLTVSPASAVIEQGNTAALTAMGGEVHQSGIFGTSSGTNGLTNYPAPYSNYYGGAKHQMLIHASELITRGFFPGANITSLGFTVSATGSAFSGVLNNFQIDIGHTQENSLGGTSFLSGLTTVLPPQSQAISIGTVVHNFTVPFVWNGISNIVIQTSYSNGNNGNSTTGVQMTQSDPGFPSTNWYRADNLSAAAVLAASTPTNFSNLRPNIILGFGLNTILSWSPMGGLYLDEGTTIPYSGGPQTTVYAKPMATVTYTAISMVQGTGCFSSGQSVITVASPCISPTNVQISQTTASTVMIGWNEPQPVPGIGYEWEIRTQGDPGSGAVGLKAAGNTYSGVTWVAVSGLEPNTLYHVYVRSNCGDNVFSTWTPDQPFSTCGVINSIPYQENFDAITVPGLPSCWTRYSSPAGTPWISSDQLANPFTAPHSAPNYMYVTYNITQPKDEWLVSPAFELTGGTNYKLKFWVQAPGYEPIPEKLNLVVSGDPTMASILAGTVLWSRTNLMLPAYTEFVVIFSPSTSGIYHFSWHAFSEANVDYIAIDDFSIEPGGPAENNYVRNIILQIGQSECYDALNTITVAGNGTTFIVQNGAGSELIAGQKISLLPGVTVHAGGYMHGWIAPSGPFCTTFKIGETPVPPESPREFSENSRFLLYPNPGNGKVTLVQKGDHNPEVVNVEIFDIKGEKISHFSFRGPKQEFNLTHLPAGIYLIKLVSGTCTENIKMIKTN